MDDLERVADAIHDAYNEVVFGEFNDEAWRRLARAAIDAIGLTEERRKLTNGWIQPMYGAPYYAMGLEPPPAVITHERRLVSPWEEDD